MPDSDDDNGFENEPSQLDELTHLEMRTLYEESTETIRFTKHLQWWTVGSTLFVDGALVGIVKLASSDRLYQFSSFGDFVNFTIATIILLTCAVVMTLTFYQLWRHSEFQKIERIAMNLSSLFRDIRKMKSRRESNVLRYVLHTFMVITVILGAIISSWAIRLIEP